MKNKSIWLLNFMKPDENNIQRIKSILRGMPIQKIEKSSKNIKAFGVTGSLEVIMSKIIEWLINDYEENKKEFKDKNYHFDYVVQNNFLINGDINVDCRLFNQKIDPADIYYGISVIRLEEDRYALKIDKE